MMTGSPTWLVIWVQAALPVILDKRDGWYRFGDTTEPWLRRCLGHDPSFNSLILTWPQRGLPYGNKDRRFGYHYAIGWFFLSKHLRGFHNRLSPDENIVGAYSLTRWQGRARYERKSIRPSWRLNHLKHSKRDHRCYTTRHCRPVQGMCMECL